jgi:hypothetical protein
VRFSVRVFLVAAGLGVASCAVEPGLDETILPPEIPDGGVVPVPQRPRAEICGNGLDDDRNGQPDDRCACMTGLFQRCFVGNPAQAGSRNCPWGRQECIGTNEVGLWGPCVGSGTMAICTAGWDSSGGGTSGGDGSGGTSGGDGSGRPGAGGDGTPGGGAGGDGSGAPGTRGDGGTGRPGVPGSGGDGSGRPGGGAGGDGSGTPGTGGDGGTGRPGDGGDGTPGTDGGGRTGDGGDGIPGTDGGGRTGDGGDGIPGTDGGGRTGDGGDGTGDGGFPGTDGGFPGTDGGFPGTDGGFPGSDGGLPGTDGGGNRDTGTGIPPGTMDSGVPGPSPTPDAGVDVRPDSLLPPRPPTCVCIPSSSRWCDTPERCAWGLQTCLPDGRWGRCVETSLRPRGCSSYFYDRACCIRSGACCQNFPTNDDNVGMCMSVLRCM